MIIKNYLKPLLKNIKKLKAPNNIETKPNMASLSSINLRNKHKNETIYIIGTGPSIREQNLLQLNGKISISLNEFFLHQDFSKISPTYNIFSGFSINKELKNIVKPEEWYNNFYKQLKQCNCKPLLNILDYDLTNNLQSIYNLESYYLELSNDILTSPKENLFQNIRAGYSGQSVSVMAISTSIFMGAKKIILIGLDHDWILTYLKNRQNHFYEDSKSMIYKNQDSSSPLPLLEYWESYSRLFKEYYVLNEFALKEGIEIINCTKGGLLDVYKRDNLENHV